MISIIITIIIFIASSLSCDIRLIHLCFQNVHSYVCRINVLIYSSLNENSRVMISTLGSAHWQQASKLQPWGVLNIFGKIEIKFAHQYQYSNYYNYYLLLYCRWVCSCSCLLLRGGVWELDFVLLPMNGYCKVNNRPAMKYLAKRRREKKVKLPIDQSTNQPAGQPKRQSVLTVGTHRY